MHKKDHHGGMHREEHRIRLGRNLSAVSTENHVAENRHPFPRPGQLPPHAQCQCATDHHHEHRGDQELFSDHLMIGRPDVREKEALFMTMLGMSVVVRMPRMVDGGMKCTHIRSLLLDFRELSLKSFFLFKSTETFGHHLIRNSTGTWPARILFRRLAIAVIKLFCRRVVFPSFEIFFPTERPRPLSFYSGPSRKVRHTTFHRIWYPVTSNQTGINSSREPHPVSREVLAQRTHVEHHLFEA